MTRRSITMKQTIAQEIVATSKDSIEALKKGEELNTSEDQDWENETTTFEFEDDSKLVVMNNEYKAM